jgi:hypothetical protein
MRSKKREQTLHMRLKPALERAILRYLDEVEGKAYPTIIDGPPGSDSWNVHEFGHVALGTSDEAAADIWAAEQLTLCGGEYFVWQAMRHFLSRAKEFNPRYGTGLDRARRLSQASRLPLPSY